MITLSILLTIWGIISFFKINGCSIKEGDNFNPFYAPLWAYMGFILSLGMSITIILFLIAKHLP